MSGRVCEWQSDDGKRRGSVTFLKSEPYFADNDLGDGAEFDLLLAFCNDIMAGDKCPTMAKCRVVIQWTDWNRLTWVQA